MARWYALPVLGTWAVGAGWGGGWSYTRDLAPISAVTGRRMCWRLRDYCPSFHLRHGWTVVSTGGGGLLLLMI